MNSSGCVFGPLSLLMLIVLPVLSGGLMAAFAGRSIDFGWLTLPPAHDYRQSEPLELGEVKSFPPTGGAFSGVLSAELVETLMLSDPGLEGDDGQTVLAALAGRPRKMRRTRRMGAARQTRQKRPTAQAVSEVAAPAEDGLNEYGRSRVVFGGHMEGYRLLWSFDYSLPIYQSEESTWLFEVGSHTQQGRSPLGGGLVYRRMVQDGPMVGVNGFVDRDLSSAHTWASFGIEWMTLWLGISSNVYIPLSSRKLCDRSQTFSFFNDPDFFRLWVRPARGFEMGLEATLPFYTPLSAAASSSYWFGNHIDIDSRDTEPRLLPSRKTFTVGWQPGPLLKMSASMRIISGQKADIRAQVELFPAEWYLRSKVSLRRLLLSPRASKPALRRAMCRRFVNRSKDLVLEYRVGQNLELNEYSFQFFGPPGGAVSTTSMSDQNELKQLCGDTGGDFQAGVFRNCDHVQVTLSNDAWVPRCYLAAGEGLDGKSVTFTREADRGTWIHYSDKKRLLFNAYDKNHYQFNNVHGVWHSQGREGDIFMSD